ncbi:hypothetical protein TNCV_3749381 [Trichonephila clavipes]|nr:hypothetical protein TNCV_3749381 [Trichonephila clavipes]
MQIPSTKSGHSSPVVKVTYLWQAQHKFEPHTTEDSSCRGGCTLNMSRLKRLHNDVVWKLGEGVPDQVCLSLDHGSKVRGPSPKRF